jgi:preprotein translocase subunit YajC
MKSLKQSIIALILLTGAAASPLVAQAPAAKVEVAMGAKVIDSKGDEVGTISALQGDNVVIKTDKHEVSVPKTSFTPAPNGLLFGMTRDQLNAEVEKVVAAQGPVVSTGATVYDPQGGVVGTVDEMDAETATIKLSKGVVKIPLTSFARGPKGPMIGETAASLEAKLAAAAVKP